jgi:tRNA G46 methylase TrmB
MGYFLCEKYNYEVAYGPFKGMKLNKDIWWSKNDRITQTLGTYEEHILESLIDFRNKGATRLIDIGAADGYFAVGMAYAKIYKNVYAFEIEQQGRYRIAENAYANGCKDSLIIQGEATHSSLAEILDGEKNQPY